MNNDLLWSVIEAAEALGVSVETLDSFRDLPDFPSLVMLPPIGGKSYPRYRPADISAWRKATNERSIAHLATLLGLSRRSVIHIQDEQDFPKPCPSGLYDVGDIKAWLDTRKTIGPPPDVETILYRHFDKSDDLLYVGVSTTLIDRIIQHRQGSHWFNAVTKITIERFPSRAAALDAEKRAIQTERPAHNTVYAVQSDADADT